MLSFFSSRLNRDSPTPSPPGECAPPFGSSGVAHLLAGEGWGSPNSDGQRVYVLHMLALPVIKPQRKEDIDRERYGEGERDRQL